MVVQYSQWKSSFNENEYFMNPAFEVDILHHRAASGSVNDETFIMNGLYNWYAYCNFYGKYRS